MDNSSGTNNSIIEGGDAATAASLASSFRNLALAVPPPGAAAAVEPEPAPVQQEVHSPPPGAAGMGNPPAGAADQRPDDDDGGGDLQQQPPSLAAAASTAGGRRSSSSSLAYHHPRPGSADNISRGFGVAAAAVAAASSASSQQHLRQPVGGNSASLYASHRHYGSTGIGGAGIGLFGGGGGGGVPERDAEDLDHHRHHLYYHQHYPSQNNQASSSSEFSTAAGWSEVEMSQDGGAGVPPSARSLHAAALLNGILYVFGGYDGNQRVNTFHAFSFAEKRWSPVLPSAGSAPPPSPRDRHVAVAFGNSIYIQGGFDGVSRVSDFWGFDFSTMAWREVHASQGRPPSPRHSHSAVVHGSSLYVFGGYDGSYKSDLHEFDFSLSRWGVVPAAGRRPRARYRATCCVHKSYMILYGGHDGTRHLSDAHVFDFETRVWNSLVCEGTPPIPRDSHVSVMHGSCMYVFGGSSGTAMNDLHELQLPPTSPSTTAAVARWRAVHTARTDQPRPRFCHVAVVYNDSMWCFGGYDGSDRLNDFLKFDFAVYDLTFAVPPATIIHDLRSLINDPVMSDITFVVEDQPIHAHKILLMRSSYFQALFLGSMRESSLDTIRLEQVRYPIFLTILEYLYTDQAHVSLSDAMELFEAADLFCIARLKTMCEKRMLQSITVSNAAAVFHAADIHSAAALRQKAKKYILSHFEEVSKSPSFEEMGRKNVDLVFELLQSR